MLVKNRYFAAILRAYGNNCTSDKKSGRVAARAFSDALHYCSAYKPYIEQAAAYASAMVHLLYFHFLSRADITKRPFKLHLYLPFCNPLSADAFLPAITICAGRERVKEVDVLGRNGIKTKVGLPVTRLFFYAIFNRNSSQASRDDRGAVFIP